MLRKTIEPSNARAHHLSATLGSLFGWLTKQRQIKINPYSRSIVRRIQRKRVHTLNIDTDVRGADELRWFWTAATAMATLTGTCANCCC
jgi:hypothetical protein